ncbi:MAG: M23 family metallopeptidase [Candidatus Saccharimonadales bacterium]
MEQTDFILHKFRFLIVGLLVVASLVLLSILFTSLGTGSAEASRINPAPENAVTDLAGSPNVVADGLASATTSLTNSLSSFTRGLQTISVATTQRTAIARQAVLSGATNILRSTGRGIGTAATTTGSGALFVLRIPGNTLGYIGNTRLVGAVIRPAEADHEVVPIIDPNSPELFRAQTAMASTGAASGADATPSWPIHGEITTPFGVYHMPYQPTHTGIDISDGAAAGVTPIHPFKPGTVIEVVHGTTGLGNHVVIDHGSGVTSVYGHLASTTVQVGQVVDKSTTLGYEGSTGVSTGTHLHFEIRVNGQAADPHNFITGQP